MHKGEPHAGHQALYNEIAGRIAQCETAGITKIEIIALLAQMVGRKIAELDPSAYDVGEVMRSVALNIASGNQDESSRILTGLPGGRPI